MVKIYSEEVCADIKGDVKARRQEFAELRVGIVVSSDEIIIGVDEDETSLDGIGFGVRSRVAEETGTDRALDEAEREQSRVDEVVVATRALFGAVEGFA